MPVRPVDLRCEGLVDPIGVGAAAPRLSWRLAAGAGETGVVQVAAQVTVGLAGSREPVWDSGRVDGWRMQTRYAGLPLPSRARCWWRVRTWTAVAGDSEPVPVASEDAHFELGLLDAGDWTGRMITPAGDVPSAAVRFATSFDVDAPPRGGRLHFTAHGVVTPLLNGKEVATEVLAPGWTSYGTRLAVRTVDVTDHVRTGRNELALVVAPGWYSGRLGFRNERAVYGDHVGVLAQLELAHDDGTSTVLSTGEDGWTAASTAWLEADLYDGETYDGGRAAAGSPPADARPVLAVPLGGAELVAPAVPPVRRTERVTPVRVHRLDGTTLAVDVGQNIVGWLRVTIDGAAAGDELVIRHAEVLEAGGRLFTAPLRTARATDRYVATGVGAETYEPRFTFHGFRYAEISGVAEAATVDVEAVVVHSDLERTGTFECSDPLVNRLHENVVWGWRGNSVSVPTDCPQRDERLGWTGDAQVFAPTAAYLYDCQTFFESWLADLRADQDPDGAVPHVVPAIGMESFAGAAGWGDAAVVVPWVLYEAYGDDRVLRDSLPSMVAWVDYVQSRLDDGVWSRDFQFGDWLDPDAPAGEPWRAKARFDLVATAYAAHACDLVARAAAVIGEDEVAARHAARFAELRETWWRRFGGEAAGTQTGCALALQFRLTPPEDEATRTRLGDRLAELVHDAGDHLATGFLGTPLLLPALSDTGHLDAAYALLHQDTAPSWLYQVKAGATTIWERWDALRPDGSVPLDALGGGSGGSMVSFNHYAYGCVADWLHRTVLGIAPDPDDPGYHHVVVAPRPGGGITWASGALETRFGRVAVAWRLDDGAVRLDLEVPPNARATVDLPGAERVTVGSGNWSFPA